MALLPTCCLIATGGTIAMRIDPATGAARPALSAQDLVAAVPDLAALASLEVTDFSNLPSDHMGPPQWVSLQRAVARALERPEVAGVVVTHGTDTLEETAWFLALTLRSAKPVVLAGAQRNASEPGFDGPRNLRAAVMAAASPDSRGRGVLVAMNDRLCLARDAAKGHTSAPEAFGPGEAGYAGCIEGDRVRYSHPAASRAHIPLVSELLPRVDIVAMYGGADGALIDAAVQNGADGVVLQALGMGNVNTAMYESVCKVVRAGVTVVVSTRVPQGRVRPAYGFVGGGHSLREAGALFAGRLGPQKARITTMLALQAALAPRELHDLLQE